MKTTKPAASYTMITSTSDGRMSQVSFLADLKTALARFDRTERSATLSVRNEYGGWTTIRSK